MVNVQIIGTPANIVIGVANVYSSFRVTRGSRRQVIDKEQLLDSDGIPTGSVLIPGDWEYDVEVECESNVNLPNTGDLVTLMSDANCVVLDVSQNWTRRGIKNASIKAYRHCK